MGDKEYYDNVNNFCQLSQSLYNNPPPYAIINGRAVSQATSNYHLNTDWRGSSTAHVRCIICDTNLKSTGKKEDPIVRCKKFNDIPICFDCYDLNFKLTEIIFSANTRDGHLWRFLTKKDFSCIIYNEIGDDGEIPKSVSTDSLTTMENSIMAPNVIKGFDAVKRNYSQCYSCGRSNEILCIHNDEYNNIINGNIHGICNIQSQKIQCSICHNRTLVSTKYWSLKYEENYESNSIKIFSTLSDTREFGLSGPKGQRPLSDFMITGPDKKNDQLDWHQKVTNQHSELIRYSIIGITKIMKLRKCKLFIEPTQGDNPLHDLLFDFQYLIIENNKIVKKHKDTIIRYSVSPFSNGTNSPLFMDKGTDIELSTDDESISTQKTSKSNLSNGPLGKIQEEYQTTMEIDK